MRPHFSFRVRTAVVIGALVALAACGHDSVEPQAEPAAPAIDARIARAETRDWPSASEAGGVVRARQTAVLASRVVAPVVEMRAAAGDRVRAGQVLVVLDGRELDAQQVRATAAASAAALGLEAARAELSAAESAHVLARATFDRIKGLHERKSATAQELDQATAGLAGAEARVTGARARVAEAEQGTAAARAAADAAAVGASYTRLTAPFAGIVASRHADPGTLVSPGMPLLTLDDVSAYRLEVRVDESRARGLTAGDDAEFRLDGDAPAAWRRARVSEIESVDPARHSVLVKIDLPRDLDVRSGQFGRARLLGPARPALVVPETAVVRRGQLAFVFVVEDGRARLRMVSAGDAADGQVEVLAGLQEGEPVLGEPPAGLADGQAVRGAVATTPGGGQ